MDTVNNVLDIERQNVARYLEENKKTYITIDKRLKKDYEKFLKKFTYSFIKNMNLDDYCVGKKDKDNFCYYVERTLSGYGSILGASAHKFGIFYSEEKEKYIYTKKFGTTAEEALTNVKNEICKIIDSAHVKNIKNISESKLSYMYKYKLYFLYSELNDLPIFNEEHIDKLINYFGIGYVKDKYKESNKREALYRFKNNDEVFSQMSNVDFMRFVYSPYFELDLKGAGNASIKENDSIELINVTQLNKKIKNERYIENKKPDYNDVAIKMSAIGDLGEELVLKYEKEHNPKYAKKIKKVSLDNDRLGYDILSYDEHGNEKHIEVKTKKAGSANNVDFYITDNELQRLKDSNHMIYYVCGITTNNKKIYVIKKDVLKNQYLEPVLYHVKAEVAK